MSSGLVSASALLVSGTFLLACSDEPEGCSERPNAYLGSIEVTGASDSDRLSDLECVEVVTGDLSIKYLSETTLESLGKLVHVFGDLEIGDALDFQKHGLSLVSLRGLERLEQVGGDLTIANLQKLSSVKALHALKKVGGSLSLDGLASIENLAGLESLESVGGDLSITHDDLLTNLDAFESLSDVGGGFTLGDNAQLASAAFGSSSNVYPPHVGGKIFIYYNASLTSLHGFGTPRGHEGPCEIVELGDIEIYNNVSLEEVVLPGGLENVCISIGDNASVKTVTGSGINAGTASLKLSGLPNLTNVDCPYWNFDALEVYQTGLATLSGFHGSWVKCSLDIRGNPALTDIAFLQESGPYAAAFGVTNNPAVATCQVQAVVASLHTPITTCDMTSPLSPGVRYVQVAGNNDAAVCQ